MGSHGAAKQSAIARIVTAFAVAILAAAWGAAARAAPPDRVIRAALGVYVHGVTQTIADRDIGVAGVPQLIHLLADPAFPRRDNVVAFLTFLAGDEATPALLGLLERPPGSPAIPEEDRALLLAPQALGHIAGRGHPQALAALLSMTEPRSGGGVLAAAAAGAEDPDAMRDDLLEMAVRGLASADTPAARERLNRIAARHIVPAPGHRDLGRAARELLDQQGLSAPAEGAVDATISSSGTGSSVGFTDPQLWFQDHAITYANHVAVLSPMSDSRLDEILTEGSLRVARADFAEDVACCATLSRANTAAVFGAANDGLDVINNSATLSRVLNDGSGRVKIVRAINYCGGGGANILGCSWVGGNGMAVVRLTSSLADEVVLWVHEYGHNIGLGHNPDSRYIMNGVDASTNNGVSPLECEALHAPDPAAEASLLPGGACGTTCGVINPGETCNDDNPCTDDICDADNRCRHPVRPECTPMAGKQLRVTDNADAWKRRITFVAHGASLVTANINPVAGGAYLQLYNPNTGESACLNLPNTGGAWRASGNSSVTYKYRDRGYANGPCRAAVIAKGKLVVKCRASVNPIPFTLDEPRQLSMGVNFISGTQKFCAFFGGKITADSAVSSTRRFRGVFAAHGAIAPEVCPIPPAPCP